MSMNGLNRYSFADVDAVNEIMPGDTTIDKKTLKTQVEKIFKRIIDIFGGLIGVIALIPLSIIIYIANVLSKDSGPVFYCQERIGKNGKLFKMYKYRSMVVGADEKLNEYLKENDEAREEYKKYKKLKNDPRVTKVGNFIRKTSLDEFPQFINVLKGEMSLVGPRPYLLREKEDMNKYYTYIIKTKPGITGFWQISGRSDVTFDERLIMDYNYSQTRSLKTDIKILIKTISNVVKKEGAM